MFKKYLSAELVPARVNLGLLVLRISLGGMMLTHGFPKFTRVLSGNFQFADPLGLGSEISLLMAVSAEFIGSLMVITGLGTRFGAALGAITMAVAGFIHHAPDPFGTKEKPFLYLAGYIVLMIAGGGKHSIESRLK